MKKFAIALGVSAIALTGAQVYASQTDGTGTATVTAQVTTGAISVTKQTDLGLGSFIPTAASGGSFTVIDGTAGNQSDVSHQGGTVTSASFDVSNLVKDHEYTASYPQAVNIGKDGSGTTVGTDAFKVILFNAATTPGTGDVGNTRTLAITPTTDGATETVTINANPVDLGTGLASGTYTGTFDLTVSF